jgi:hypothetical protein
VVRPATGSCRPHQLELQPDDHAEVALAAAHRPEQLRLAVSSDLPQLPVSADDVDAAYPVGGEAVAAAERPDPASEGIADDAERGQLSANIRLLADPRDREVLSGYLHQALVCALAATTGIMAVVLLASQGGPLISQGVRLYAVFGYNLLVISAALMIRVLFARVRWRQGPRDPR